MGARGPLVLACRQFERPPGVTARIAVVGLPYFGARAASGLREVGFRAHYAERPGTSPGAWAPFISEIARADLLYAIGSSIRRNGPLDVLARLGKRVLMHWVGSDVLAAEHDFAAGRCSSKLVRDAAHWADAPWLVERLAMLGIAAELRTLPIPLSVGTPAVLPAHFRVLVYLPAKPTPAYDIESTVEVMRALPEIEFSIIGGYQLQPGLSNTRSCGFVEDMAAAYRDSVALLRLVHHDGLSHSVIEALSFGRYVLWTYPLAGVEQVASAPAAIAALERLHRRFTGPGIEPNLEGARAVTERYNWTSIRSEVREGIDRLLT